MNVCIASSWVVLSRSFQPVGFALFSRSFRRLLTFGRERRDAPEAFQRAADSLGSGGVVVESVVDLDTGAVEQLVLEVGRWRKRNGEGLVGFLAPDEPRREHTRGDGQPEVHDVHSEHAVGLRWEDDLVESVCPLPFDVTVHVLVGVLVPEVGEHVYVRGVNGGDSLAPC